MSAQGGPVQRRGDGGELVLGEICSSLKINQVHTRLRHGSPFVN